MHPFLLHNGQIHPISENSLSAGQTGLLTGWGVFTTVRVIDRVMFAFERHFARMKRDAKLLNVPFPDSSEWLEKQLYTLIDANQALNSTLRVSIIRNKGGMFSDPAIAEPFDVVAFTKDLKDWGTSTSLEIVPKTRHADHLFAGTKMLSWSFNLVLLENSTAKGFDELIMLNERGEVSECTSANIFAVFGNQVITPPLSSGCLPGVTRAILLEELQIPGIELRTKPLLPQDLEEADEIFITSTTRDVLAVRHIEGLSLKRDSIGPISASLLDAYRNYRKLYAENHQRAALV